eukprot:6460775-Amphidinium_carterae.1
MCTRLQRVTAASSPPVSQPATPNHLKQAGLEWPANPDIESLSESSQSSHLATTAILHYRPRACCTHYKDASGNG